MEAALFSEDHTSKEFRRELFRIYNDVNKDIYGFGVVSLRIVFVEDMIVFRTQHNRVRALQVLEERDRALKQEVDYALFLEFKKRFLDRLVRETDLDVASILRDYDSATQTAVTVVCVSEEGGRS